MIRKCIWIFLVCFAALQGTVYLSFQALHATLLKPHQTMDYVSSEQLKLLVMDAVERRFAVDWFQDEGLGSRLQALLNDAIQAAIASTLSETWLTQKAMAFQGHLWDYIEGETNQVAPISIQEVHDAILVKYDQAVNTSGLRPWVSERVWEELRSQLEQRLPVSLQLLDVLNVDYNQLEKLKSSYEWIIELEIAVRKALVLTIIALLLFSHRIRSGIRSVGTVLIVAVTLSWLGLNGIFRSEKAMEIINDSSVQSHGPIQILLNGIVKQGQADMLQWLQHTSIPLLLIGLGMVVLTFLPRNRILDWPSDVLRHHKVLSISLKIGSAACLVAAMLCYMV